ncbi:MAG: hypothetical protein HRT94_04335 [Alphaproteobacteria bacterium]|nr:hypothetical protein [Alphaproteobacteria bacterium]
MSDLSLQNIMNEMAKGELVIATPAPSDDFVEKCQTPLSEIDSFASMDEVLAHLQNEFLNAKAYHERLVRENGADDAMTEVAADMMDSAWCAMQTRLMEVRASREMMAKAQNMMRASARKIKENKEEKEKKKALALAHKMQMLQHVKNMKRAQNIRKERDKIPFFEVVFLLMMFKLLPAGLHNRPQYQYAGHAA